MLSNVVNNLPAVLVLLPLVSASGPAAVLAMLLGVNIGPNLTYVGSLANLLWRSVVRNDFTAGFREFSRVGLVTTPVTLVVAVLGLWVRRACSVFSRVQLSTVAVSSTGAIGLSWWFASACASSFECMFDGSLPEVADLAGLD